MPRYNYECDSALVWSRPTVSFQFVLLLHSVIPWRTYIRNDDCEFRGHIKVLSPRPRAYNPYSIFHHHVPSGSPRPPVKRRTIITSLESRNPQSTNTNHSQPTTYPSPSQSKPRIVKLDDDRTHARRPLFRIRIVP